MSRGEHRLTDKSAPYVTNVPFAMSWTGHIAAGSKISTRLENIDLAPTVCAIAGCTLRPAYPDGIPAGRTHLRAALLQKTPFTRDAVLEELDERKRRRAELGIGDHDHVFAPRTLAVH